ncbi:hypothetical protein HHI36_000581 [Cryptolaemus montrouzieri]|uniref:Ig-like domain-containing protein n=1 Tax=Cryptolaemus montrouzieri TaxID=559131 RepID=A0ABD2P5C1_9CUCU
MSLGVFFGGQNTVNTNAMVISRSNSRKVTLRDVERETAGIFKCEVSADAPLFHTDMRSARLLVADIPDEEPVLRTDVHKITPGARISANCTTPGSFPSMNVTWYINDQETDQISMTENSETVESEKE